MSELGGVGQRERLAQNRVAKHFQDGLGYEYLGNWEDRPENKNVEEKFLRANLEARGYEDGVITKALFELDRLAATGGARGLYEANKEVYEALRYGIKVSPEAGENKETVWLIDWEHPEANDFAIAEEVTVEGRNTKRPDIVLYVNGIALGVLELKRSLINVTEGIRQNIGNQRREFIEQFFSTVQLVMAGNDTEGLRYGVIETPEKYWLRWREEEEPASDLDVGLTQLCSKERFLELIHDFIVFDAGIKKICRYSQYFGVKAAQARVEDHEGGIIWHAQGSGKSLTMVWLAKWIREHQPDARVLLITDREELDEQIERVFLGVQEEIYRTKSGTDLIAQLGSAENWLLCSLIHKFGRAEGAESIEAFIEEIKASLPDDFAPKGNFFVFVDECHRTQSGKLNAAMQEILPEAMSIGFTGTPLLRSDKKKSVETFGTFIHTYKFDEAVKDEVILDLRYEARDIDQELSSPEKADRWFEAKTRNLTDLAKAELKRRWGTMKRLQTARARAEKIVDDVLMDMETEPRLLSGRGNALLVSGDIYQACKFCEIFSQTSLKGKLGIVTSYKPHPGDIAKEDAGAGANEEIRKYEIYRQMLADYFDEPADDAIKKIDAYEDAVKRKFVEEPGQMRLLIVVDKLLTGFDAPPATYLYIDKPMRDHGLFQAICRVNRLDSEDKEYGYIIDYRDLFKSIESAYADYTGEALSGYDDDDVVGLLKDRLEKGREDLDDALETIRALCEPVEPPKGTLEHLRYFCAEDTADPDRLKANESKRVDLYKAVTQLVRAYAAIATEIEDAGYSTTEAKAIKDEVSHYEKVRQEVKLGAGESIDYTAYEADMRRLLDSYIRAEDSETVVTFDDQGLVQMLAQNGADTVIENLPKGTKSSQEAIAETIENNVRKLIIDEQPINPKYYEKMSELLDALIKERRKQALSYRKYLEKLQQLAKQAVNPTSGNAYPPEIKTEARRALYDNLDGDAELATAIDDAVMGALQDEWRGSLMKERRVRIAIERALGVTEEDDKLAEVFELVKAQRDY